MLIPTIILTVITAIFHEVAAAIAHLQFDVINFGDAAGGAAHHLASGRSLSRFCTHLLLSLSLIK
jgi:hypothetical protein